MGGEFGQIFNIILCLTCIENLTVYMKQVQSHSQTIFWSENETGVMGGKIKVASFPGSHARECEIEVVQAWRAWYFLSREKRQR